jgi:isopenicillin-N epimerase
MNSDGWSLDPEVAYLNHGGFGAVPLPVAEVQQQWRVRIEANPHRFLGSELADLIDESRDRLAGFAGTVPERIAFVRNATAGVNAVLGSIDFSAGDRVVVTDHEYNACRNALDAVARRRGVLIDVVRIPIPVTDEGAVVNLILEAVTPETRLLLIDAVTSPTAIVMPLESIVPVAEAMGVPVLVDAAHAPGMVPLQLDRLGASYTTGNLHKWVCAPRGAAFLHARDTDRDGLMPTAISHGWNDSQPGRSRYHKQFDWTGTDDFTPWLAVPSALDFLDSRPGGWAGVADRNRQMVLRARRMLCDELGFSPVAPEGMVASMAALTVTEAEGVPSPGPVDPSTRRLSEEWKIEVPVFSFPRWPHRVLRISAQMYNTEGDYRRLIEAWPHVG